MDNMVHEKVISILENAKGNTLDVCYILYNEYIAAAEFPSEVLQLILQYGRAIGTSDAPAERINEGLKDSISSKYYGLLHEVVRFIMSDNLSVDGFYHKLYEQIFASELFPQKAEERAVVLWLLADKISEVPYYQAINLLEMENDKYKEAIGRIDPQIKQAFHVLSRSFGSRTEETSQFYRISTEIKDESDRIVYWSVILSFFKKDEE